MRRILALILFLGGGAPALAQETVPLSDLPTIADGGADFCGVLRQEKAAGLTEATRATLRSELRRRGGFNASDIRVLTRPDANVGFGMSLRGLRCALGEGVEVVYVRRYGGTQTWQVRLVRNFPRATVKFAWMEGNGTEAGMRVRSLI